MITDKETNFLYLADSLKHKKYSAFLDRFTKTLNQYSIPCNFIPNTKDIWAVDFMPIQINTNKFVQFIYNPDYLRKNKKLRETISDVDNICNSISLTRHKSAILLDGGNVIKTKDKIILCDKVFNENPNIPKDILINLLIDIFEVSDIIFVPWDESDFTGHADGMVRFLDNNTVFINNYPREKEFQKKVIKSIDSAGLNYIEIPYNPYNNKSVDQANGVYINYLQIGDIVFVPTFGMKEDDIAIKQFEKHFKIVVAVDSNEIANDGGILNCITWNIKK